MSLSESTYETLPAGTNDLFTCSPCTQKFKATSYPCGFMFLMYNCVCACVRVRHVRVVRVYACMCEHKCV